MADKRKVDWSDLQCVRAYVRNPGDFEIEDWFGKGNYTEDRREKLKDVTVDDIVKAIQERRSRELQPTP
jgi:hypothetical protein